MSDLDEPNFEAEFWGDVRNTFHEEQKQLVYAPRMGLRPDWGGAHPPTFDLNGVSVIDIGGGPISLLLKCVNYGHAVVADPGVYPAWVRRRYEACGIQYLNVAGEKLPDGSFGEAWIYNVLLHTDDPEKIIANARALALVIRIFEWIDIDPYPGHPQRLERQQLDEWLGAPGYVSSLNESGAVGTAYYGVFTASGKP